MRKGEIKIIKVGTYENLADALTKFVSREGIDTHMHGTGQIIAGGRHELAPKVEG